MLCSMGATRELEHKWKRSESVAIGIANMSDEVFVLQAIVTTMLTIFHALIMYPIVAWWLPVGQFFSWLLQSIGAWKPWEPNWRACDLRHRVVVVTGANRGVGKETATELVKMGATVVLAVRSMLKGQKARRDIIEEARLSGSPHIGKVVVMHLDLSFLNEINDFCRSFREMFERLDVLVLNAGAARVHDHTIDNVDVVSGTNFLGHFMLLKALFPYMDDTAKKTDEPLARVVVVSSTLHQWGQQDLRKSLEGYPKRFAQIRMMLGQDSYCDSKLHLTLMALEMNKRAKAAGSRVRAITVNPGAVLSDIWKIVPSPIWEATLRPVLSLVFLSTKQGCTTSVAAATVPPHELWPHIYPYTYTPTPTEATSPRGIHTPTATRIHTPAYTPTQKLPSPPGGTHHIPEARTHTDVSCASDARKGSVCVGAGGTQGGGVSEGETDTHTHAHTHDDVIPPYLSPYFVPFDFLLWPCDVIGPYVGYNRTKPRLPHPADKHAQEIWAYASKLVHPHEDPNLPHWGGTVLEEKVVQ